MSKPKRRITFAGSPRTWSVLNISDLDYFQILEKKYEILLVDISEADYVFINETRESRQEFLKENAFNKVSIYVAQEAHFPDFNLFDYALGFDEIDFGDRYLRFTPGYRFARKLSKPKELIDFNEKLFCDFIYSNHRANKRRDELFYLLSGINKVFSYGRHVNNATNSFSDKIQNSSWLHETIQIHSHHKFSIAAENSLYKGYTSEKVFAALAAGVIPIYWGNEEISKDVNPRRIISAHEYSSDAALLDRVSQLANDPTQYAEILKLDWFTKEQEDSVANYPKVLERFLDNIFSQNLEAAHRKGDGTFIYAYQQHQRRSFRFGNIIQRLFEMFELSTLKKRLMIRIKYMFKTALSHKK